MTALFRRRRVEKDRHFSVSDVYRALSLSLFLCFLVAASQVNFQNAHRPLPTFHLWDYSDTEQAFLQTITSPSRQRFAASVMKLDEGTWRHSPYQTD
jgi:hypothetical protein